MMQQKLRYLLTFASGWNGRRYDCFQDNVFDSFEEALAYGSRQWTADGHQLLQICPADVGIVLYHELRRDGVVVDIRDDRHAEVPPIQPRLVNKWDDVESTK